MFNIAKKDGKVTVVPHVPMLAEKNVRKGFFDHFTYIRLQKVLPDRLKPVVSLAYRTGMRHGEVLSLTWDQVDFNARVIRLEPHTTKNDSPRIVPMGQELHDELLAQRQLRDQSFPFCKHVFFSPIPREGRLGISVRLGKAPARRLDSAVLYSTISGVVAFATCGPCRCSRESRDGDFGSQDTVGF